MNLIIAFERNLSSIHSIPHFEFKKNSCNINIRMTSYDQNLETKETATIPNRSRSCLPFSFGFGYWAKHIGRYKDFGWKRSSGRWESWVGLLMVTDVSPTCAAEAIFGVKSWLPHRLSKPQSPTTVLVSTPVTQMIIANQGILVLASLGTEKPSRIQVSSLRTTSELTTMTQKG